MCRCYCKLGFRADIKSFDSSFQILFKGLTLPPHSMLDNIGSIRCLFSDG